MVNIGYFVSARNLKILENFKLKIKMDFEFIKY